MEYADAKLELKELNDEGEFSGYASVFGNVDQGRDIIVKGAFDKTLDNISRGERKARLLWQHNPGQPIGVIRGLKSDDHGLRVEAKLSLGTTLGREAHALLKDGAVDSMSIGYKTVDYEIQKKENGGSVRLLKQVDLWETSIVTFPMNESALVTDVKQLQSERDVERLLREAGVPGAFAKLVALHGYEGAKNRINSPRDEGVKAAEREELKSLFSEIQRLKEILNA